MTDSKYTPSRPVPKGPTTSAAQIADALGGKPSSNGWNAKCPAHDDAKPSLSISEAQDGSILAHCHAGCPQEEVIKALKCRGLWSTPTEEDHLTEYNYTDQNGNLRYQIVRKSGKRFLQRYPNDQDGWTWKKHPQQILYNLPAILKAECVLVVEGEKDANTHTRLRVHPSCAATTNAGGANAPWLPEFTATLAGKIVVLVPDNDSPGWTRVLRIARSLIGKVQKVIVRAPANGAKDISDWVADQKAERLLLDDPIEISTAADIDALESKLLAEGKIDSKAALGSSHEIASNTKPKSIATPANRPKVMSVADVMALKVEPHMDLIENFLPARGASLIFGSPKSNKTLLSVQAAIAVASGERFLGRYKVLKSGPVLILSQDDPDGGASVQQLFKKSPIPTKGLPIYTVPCVPFPFGIEFIEWLRSEIAEKKLVFVVLDSYTKLRGSHSSGGDIVKAEQTDLTMLDELAKQTGCSILIVHHSSKGSAALEWSEQAAGTYAMAASTENQIHISRFKELVDDAPERLVRIRGRHTNGIQMVLRFRSETLDHEHVLESAGAELYPLVQTLWAAFTTEPFSPKELKLETGMSHSTAHTKIRRLLQTGLIRKNGYGSYLFNDVHNE